MTTDFITILTHNTTPLSKRWGADGSIQAFGHAKHFAGREIPVSNFGEMAATLTALHGKPRSCVIRGRFTGQDLTNTVRQKDVFADTEHHWLLIDVDKYQPLEADPVTEPVESIEQYIHEHLPQEFHDASYHWQLSNSAGHPTKQGLRAHLWFWSETPHSSATLRAWGAGYLVDQSLFDEIQIHYTAAPVFDEGVADPVPVRSGTVRKRSDVVQLTAAPATPSDRPSRQQVARETLSTDPVAQLLYEKGLVKSERRNDMGLNIECPCSDRHTSDSGESSTIYYPANTGGYAQRAFKCLHAGCTGSPQSDFLEALGYEEPSIADDFDDVSDDTDEEPTEPPKDKFRVKDITEFLSAPPLSWWIKGVLPAARLAMIYGKSGSGKTFIALDMAIAMALGKPWRGHHAKQGRVVFVCAEGVGGFRNRIRAAEHHYGIKLDKLIGVIDIAPNLLEKVDAVAIAKSIIEWNASHGGGAISAVFVDTMAQVMAGGNENAGEDVGTLLSHCNEISRVTGAITVLIHHSGKDEGRGSRGWSGMRGACDAEYEVTNDNNSHAMKVTKMKDGDGDGDYGYKLLVVPIGLDEAGDVISSCVVEHTNTTSKDVKKAMRKPGKHEVTVLEVLNSQMIDLTAGIPEEAIIRMAIDATPVPDGKDDRRRDLITRALSALKTHGAVRFEDGKLYLPDPLE